ncbi:MAG: MBL fold metallo-hydrolase [Nitriliruptorales bacterium]
MKLTKYPQSCLLLEKDGARIVIDPGNRAMNAYTLDDFGDLEAVLYTHRHPDHFDDRQVEELLERGVELFGNADVCGLIGREHATELTDGQTLEIAGFDVTVRDLPHVPLVDGSAGPPNSGYVIDGFLFHPGDGIELSGLTVDALAVPIAGPSISFRDAYRFIESVGAKTALPIHYDTFIADPARFADFCDIAEVVILDHGETTTL